jgi:hypothetical protein
VPRLLCREEHASNLFFRGTCERVDTAFPLHLYGALFDR